MFTGKSFQNISVKSSSTEPFIGKAFEWDIN